MGDRSNWERERMRDRGHEGNRENWGQQQEDWRGGNEWKRDPRYSTSEESNRGREGRYGYSGEEWNRERGRDAGYGEGRQQFGEYRGGFGGGEGAFNEGRFNEGRGNGGRFNEGRGNEGRWNEGRYDASFEGSHSHQGSRGFEGSREGWRENEGSQRRYAGSGRGDYGPGAFTQQFGQGTEYFGTGQRGYGTTWGGTGFGGGSSGYMGGSGSASGGVGSYGEEGRYSGRGPKGYQRSDERIREDVCERLTRHPEIDAGEIDIQVKNGEVTLTGTVERREEKRMAEDVAESVSGVKDVHNQLRAQQHHQGATAGQGTQSNTQTTHSNPQTAAQKK